MSRQTLFRGKALIGGEWIYGGYTYDDADKDHMITQVNEDGLVIGYVVDPSTVGQFTGLTDKNGVKIWEGDICRIMLRKKYGHERDGLSRPLGAVEYSRLAIREDSLYVFDTFNIRGKSIHYLLSMELEVIGNKFDNPELT